MELLVVQHCVMYYIRRWLQDPDWRLQDFADPFQSIGTVLHPEKILFRGPYCSIMPQKWRYLAVGVKDAESSDHLIVSPTFPAIWLQYVSLYLRYLSGNPRCFMIFDDWADWGVYIDKVGPTASLRFLQVC